MPYTTPTASELKARYPEFDSVSDTLVDFAISDAGRFVDETWFEDDYQRAIMALAAHFLAQDGALGGSTVVSGNVTSEKLGDASVSYGAAVGAANNEYGTTSYGRAFLRIQRANVPSVVIL